jgi:hypothetical protein
MYLLNRSIAVVKARQPFFDWVGQSSALVYETFEEFIQAYTTTLLLPVFSRGDAEAMIREIYPQIFEMELRAWNDAGWPVERSYSLFQAWFDVEFHLTVLDVSEAAIIKEPY